MEPATSGQLRRHRLTARNRVWLALRRLPLPWPSSTSVDWFVVDWFPVALVCNLLRPATLRAVAAGMFDDLRELPGPLRPIRWATAWRLSRLGRPPII